MRTEADSTDRSNDEFVNYMPAMPPLEDEPGLLERVLGTFRRGR
ncbi:hypothetical protein [Natronobacterium gregoryi]|uniref:Uncharacterized protein n=2 Tax=Natronobacterium gregoryi TaxID=44930 RepID=L0AJQ6_NATGS|nr:hypothetical protein [Natronobacterium gregoryi]AFZ74046.1 hypothetical protein Natgr_2908 [Natronobacterium gregoryi SP2]SFJ06869.1 hypothetical protein SAMN05443661_11334 [Natronobacterium gregoryi]